MAYESSVAAPLRQLPNALTVARFAAIPLFVVLLVRDQDGPSWAAGIVFALAAITDQLDGWLARRWRVESAFGKVFLDRTAAGPAFLNWAVLVEDIVAVAARVEELTGLDPEMFSGESVRADGQAVPWAEAAFMLSWESRVLPFFLRYGNAEARAGRVAGDLAAAGHKVVPTAIDAVHLGGADAHGQWLAGWPSLDALPVRHDPAAGVGVLGVQLSTEDGTALLERL